jgi:hypothetical protein
MDDERPPQLISAAKPDVIVWSSLWEKRPDARVRFDLASDGAAGTFLRWTLLVEESLPDLALLGHLRTVQRSGTAAWSALERASKYDAAKTRRIAEAAIREAVQTKDNPADLINVALQGLGYHLERATGGRRRAGRRQGHPGHRRLGGQALRLTPTRSR